MWLNFAKGTSGGAINFPFIGKQAGVHSPFKKEPGPESAYLQEIRLGFYESRDPGIVSLPLLRNMGEEGVWLPEAAEGLINGPPACRSVWFGGGEGPIFSLTSFLKQP
ncbi:hypothetical protein [Thiovibrio frasassiensis]|uniref:Uncharacterized protein n=1 Tax=Thiovibrio frasassiensis TaxID=2984131 RepID=A0A9X4RKL3_9BACT|nr:hypothetical protein [Thiovibrio frasassiensis]MDG4475146.1 hypothetical protein [Thiovibrio frasassiensis]